MDAGLRAIPGLLAQAKANLTGNGRDLWIFGTKVLQQQSKELADFAKTDPTGLQASVERAKAATDELTAWLDAQAPSKNGPSGIGIENYDWYLKHVQLVPLNWQEEVALHERELGRSRALLAMEEIRNAALPPQTPIANAAEYQRLFDAAVADYLAFLKAKQILTVKPYMEPALRARGGSFSSGPLRLLRRGRLPRPRGHAHARLPLVRQGLDDPGAAVEPDPPGRPPSQPRQHAHRGPGDRVGRADDAGRACSTRGRARGS